MGIATFILGIISVVLIPLVARTVKDHGLRTSRLIYTAIGAAILFALLGCIPGAYLGNMAAWASLGALLGFILLNFFVLLLWN